eukprot:6488580-Amphidinium_carterae.1
MPKRLSQSFHSSDALVRAGAKFHGRPHLEKAAAILAITSRFAPAIQTLSNKHQLWQRQGEPHTTSESNAGSGGRPSSQASDYSALPGMPGCQAKIWLSIESSGHTITSTS